MAGPDSLTTAEKRRRLRAWFRGMPGRMLRAEARKHLDQLLPGLFGYHLVQVGSVGDDAELQLTSRVNHRVLQDCQSDGDAGQPGLLARADALPYAESSVDVLLLPHVLEFEQAPHEVLREAWRVLVPEGHVLVVGFNPWSLWGLSRLLHRRRGTPWGGRFFAQTRIRDWLALLGFQVVALHHFGFRPPLRSEALLRRLAWLERVGARWWPPLGGGYVLVARKRVRTLTPLRPRWRSRRSRLLGGVVEPTTRGMQRRG